MWAPVQRPPRYLLLLKAIVDNTPEDHVDLANLKEVKHQFFIANDLLNERMRSFNMVSFV